MSQNWQHILLVNFCQWNFNYFHRWIEHEASCKTSKIFALVDLKLNSLNTDLERRNYLATTVNLTLISWPNSHYANWYRMWVSHNQKCTRLYTQSEEIHFRIGMRNVWHTGYTNTNMLNRLNRVKFCILTNCWLLGKYCFESRLPRLCKQQYCFCH